VEEEEEEAKIRFSGEGKRQRLGNVNTAAFIHTDLTGQRADVWMNFEKFKVD